MDEATQGDSNKPGAFLSERHRNPAELLAQGPKNNHVVAGIFAILATIVFAAVVFALYTDLTALGAA